jgi:ATP-dependent Zn protease
MLAAKLLMRRLILATRSPHRPVSGADIANFLNEAAIHAVRVAEKTK